MDIYNYLWHPDWSFLELMQDGVKGVKGVGVNSVVLDSMLSPFGKELSAATNLPVFDEVSMLKLFSSASSLSHFSDASVLCRLDEKSQSQRSCLVCKFRAFLERLLKGCCLHISLSLILDVSCLLHLLHHFDNLCPMSFAVCSDFLPCTVSSVPSVP